MVFTPKGDVKRLPKDATPLDFAYSIHSEIGNKCVGAKVNSKIVPLNTVLKVGDLVEVITSQNSKGPSWDWLKIVKSSSARIKIKQFFKKEMKEENCKTGKEMLEEEAKKRGYKLSELLTDEAFLRLAAKMSFSNPDEMFASVGYGAVSVNQVLLKLIDFYRKTKPVEEAAKFFVGKKATGGGVKVKGTEGILVHFAGCCNPVPGDDVIGFISRGHGVAVHRKDCPNLKNVEKERLIEVSWEDDLSGAYNAEIKVIGESQTEVLTIVAAACALYKLAIISTNGRTDSKTGQANVEFNIRINNKSELDVLIAKLKQNPKISNVFRTAT